MAHEAQRSVNLHKISAKDIMSEVVVTIKEDTLVKQAAHLMLRDRINGVPVLDANAQVTGVLTLSDLFKIVNRAALDQQHDFFEELFHGREFKAADIMTRDVFLITPDTTLDEIVHVILEKNIHTFPVMHDGKLAGIIGKHDVLNAVFCFY